MSKARLSASRTISFFALAMAAFVGLAGCSQTMNDQPNYGPSVNPPIDSQAADLPTQVELARAADRYLGASTPGRSIYRVGPQDVLEITVYQAPELSKTLQVAEEGGTINLPLIGRINVVGKTATAIEHDIEARLDAKYIKGPQVNVFVKEFNSQRMIVDGAVKKPGVFPIRGRETLMQAIGSAGGIDRETSSTDVIVFRSAQGGRSVTRYNTDEIINGRMADPQILSGDVIVVQESLIKTSFQYAAKALPLATSIALVATRF